MAAGKRGADGLRGAILVLTIATLAFIAWLAATGPEPAAPSRDPRLGTYLDPRRTLARIQSDMNRAAVSRQPRVAPPDVGSDSLEALVDAYRLLLDGNVKAMDVQLHEIERLVRERTQAIAAMPDPALRRQTQDYFTALSNDATRPEALTRLLATLRMVDATLFMEAVGWNNGDVLRREVLGAPHDPHTNSWLRLPCRTVLGRVTSLAIAQTRLGERAGPLLSCPSDNGDLTILEAQANAPAMLPFRIAPIPPRPPLPSAEPMAPPRPWDHETAVAWMDEDPEAAAHSLSSPESTADRLDYALFLHAFSPEDSLRLAGVQAQLDVINTAAMARATASQTQAAGPLATYDGSDLSLGPSLRLAVASGAASGYAVPCAVLQARPGLLPALEPVAGMDTPRSGCAHGRGMVRGFPDAVVADFRFAAEDADGHYLAHHPASVWNVRLRGALERLKLNPLALATAEPPSLDHPYQVWGLLGLDNRAVEQDILPQYRKAATAVAEWYRHQGLSQTQAERAAKTGLFQLVLGADCGGQPPSPSVRAMILDKAPIADIRDALGSKEPPEIAACASHGGLDPLPLVAVTYPEALVLLLDRGTPPDQANDFGKTALMVAAAHDQAEAVRLLLDRGADINAATWTDRNGGLDHDGRTPLMYAAARGSLAMVKLLLSRGADPQTADTKGARAIDYLLGFGPVAANARMTPEERAEAARLLF